MPPAARTTSPTNRDHARSTALAASCAAAVLCLIVSNARAAEAPSPPAQPAPAPAAPAPSEVQIRNVATSWDNLSELFSGGGMATPFSEGSVFVIRGELINGTAKPIHHVVLRYELLGDNGQVVHDMEGYNRLAEAMRPDESGKVDENAVKAIAPRGNDTFRMVFFSEEIPRFSSHRVRVVEVHDH